MSANTKVCHCCNEENQKPVMNVLFIEHMNGGLHEFFHVHKDCGLILRNQINQSPNRDRVASLLHSRELLDLFDQQNDSEENALRDAEQEIILAERKIECEKRRIAQARSYLAKKCSGTTESERRLQSAKDKIFLQTTEIKRYREEQEERESQIERVLCLAVREEFEKVYERIVLITDVAELQEHFGANGTKGNGEVPRDAKLVSVN